MKADFTYIKKRWNYLKSHQAFQKAPVRTIFYSASWVVHCLFGIPAIIKLPKWGCRFFLPPKFLRAGTTAIFVTREDYEAELTYLGRVLSHGKVFVDGGANIGIYTVLAGKLVGDSGVVLSFEPAAESFSILERNVELNHLNNVRMFRWALSDREDQTHLYHIDNAPSSYSLGSDLHPGANFEEISTTTLDNVLRQEGVERVDFIKLDVEGAEELVFRGAKTLFSRMRPIVLFEVNQNAIQRLGLSKDGAWNFLKELGYQFFAIGNKGELLNLDFPHNKNIIAIPE